MFATCQNCYGGERVEMSLQPEKISSLWYDQFVINCYTFNCQAGPPGILLSLLLDKKWAVRAILSTLLVATTIALGRPLHFMVKMPNHTEL